MENKLIYLYSLYEAVKADMDKLNIPYTKNVPIKINTRAKRMHGCCRKVNGQFVIEISDFLFNYSKNEIMNTIAHEMIHTCYGCFNHGKRFKYYCDKINSLGYNVTTTYKGEEVNQVQNEAKYMIMCENCKTKVYRMKKSKIITNSSAYRCSKCKGKLKVYKIIKK